MRVQKDERDHYWWKLSHPCPKCHEELALCNFYYAHGGKFKVFFLCIKCAKEFYWIHDAFELAHQAQDRDDYQSFLRTPLEAEIANPSGT
jgi:hypothetical protein